MEVKKEQWTAEMAKNRKENGDRKMMIENGDRKEQNTKRRYKEHERRRDENSSFIELIHRINQSQQFIIESPASISEIHFLK